MALDEQPENSVLQPAIRLCKSLNRKVVAVGVETEEQMASLQAAECDEIQGFLLSAPRDAADTTELLIQQNKPQAAPKATPGPSDDKGSG